MPLHGSAAWQRRAEENSMKTGADGTALFAGEAWFDPAANASRFGEIEAGIRERVRGFIEELIGQELEAVLGRGRYERDARAPAAGFFRPGAAQRAAGAEGDQGRRGSAPWLPCSAVQWAKTSRKSLCDFAGWAAPGARCARIGKPGTGATSAFAQRKRLGEGEHRPPDPGETGGLRRDGQKVLLAVKNMDGESGAAFLMA